MTIRTQTEAEKKRSPVKKQGNNIHQSEGVAGRFDPNSEDHILLQLQRTHGNQTVQRLVKESNQSTLRVRKSGDPSEREADQVADQVMRMEDSGIKRQASGRGEEELIQTRPLGTGISRLEQRQENIEEDTVQIKSLSQAPTTSEQRQINDGTVSLTGPGRPLNPRDRAFMERRFGHDFGRVRIHTHQDAAESAKAVNARAYTVGSDIMFDVGQYAPGTGKGRQLLAHELTHVIQQDKTSNRRPVVQRLAYLGSERWKVDPLSERVMPVWTRTKEEWISVLDDIDDRDEYWEELKGFLEVSNNPQIVGRTTPPRQIGNVPYSNTISREISRSEKLAFLQALYEMGGSLDLWRGGFWEGGAWAYHAEDDLTTFLNNYQGMIIADVSQRGEVISSTGVRAIAEQGGRRPAMAMIINAGATAHKAVDLITTANRMSGQARESAHATAMETIRNAGRVIRETLKAHDARVAFQQQVAGVVFDRVWGLIPGGGTVTSSAKDLLKTGLKEALKNAQAEEGPRAQAEAINNEFVATCNRLVRQGEITSADAQDAINGFEAVRR